MFVTLPLEILGKRKLKTHSWKFHKTVLGTVTHNFHHALANGFCTLRNPGPPHPPPFPAAYVLNGQNQDGWNTNENQMKNTPPFYIEFQVLKVLLTKVCKISHQIF